MSYSCNIVIFLYIKCHILKLKYHPDIIIPKHEHMMLYSLVIFFLKSLIDRLHVNFNIVVIFIS